MKIINTKITLPEGAFDVDLEIFDNSDLPQLKHIYQKWVDLSDSLQEIGGRRINLPEALSEAIFCINFNAGRLNESISKANTSFDCYQINTKKRIQVKACSVSNDLTSFGPSSVWDELYFVHFFPNKKYDGSYSIFKIENDLIYNHKVNATQTMRDQQKQDRRPRFSIIKEIITPNNIRPIIQGSLII